MTDAYDTLREMLANVPDDAQVYVEELESIVEWPGITAGTFRQLLAEIAGFEWAWEAREKAHDAALAEVTKERDAHREQSRINDEVALCYRRDWQQAKAQLATAKREGAYEALTAYSKARHGYTDPLKFRDHEYLVLDPACGSTCKPDCCLPGYCAPGKGCHTPKNSWDISEPRNPATPSPEAKREVPSDIVLPVEESVNGRWMWRNDFRAVITPEVAKRIVNMGLVGGSDAE